MSILDETGQPATVPDATGDSAPEADKPQPTDVVAEVRVLLKGDGNITVSPTTPDLRLVLRMLHEAADIMLVNLSQAQTLSRLSRAQIAKPGLRDVLALAKH